MIKENFYGENIDELFFFKIKISGVLHVGAHKCEELNTYLKYTNKDNILWLEAIPAMIEQNLKTNPDLNIIQAVVSDVDNQDVEFKITNLTNCSSILDLNYHKEIHPYVEVIDVLNLKTKTLKTILTKNKIENKYNTLVLDIQGAELMALKGLDDLINNFDTIYTEVNEEELYIGCCRLEELDTYLNSYSFKRKYINTLNGYGNALYQRISK
jgi:FkbM family methyltransferase